MGRTTNFKRSDGKDLGDALIDKGYLLSVYLGIPGGSRLYSWGRNNFGRLGDNTNATRSTPRQEFTSGTNWKQVACGADHTAAIKTDGTLWLWGYNYYGTLGDNTTASRSTPRQEFTSGTNWKQVSAGSYHTAAIKTDGTLWLWGFNNYGQLGDNTIGASRSTPRQEFTSGTNWKQVAGGNYHTAAIKTDGTLWLWGYNYYGQLGNNTQASRSTPRQEFTSGTDWKQVACGADHTAAIKTNGTLWLWGRNSYGQLGDNTTATRSTPRQEFTSGTNWKQVACGADHTAAIKTDGTLWCWGRNYFGPVGDNTQADRSTPRQEFTSGTNWKQVAGSSSSSGRHTAAIKTDGTLWVWGDNRDSQVGDNTGGFGNFRFTPRQEFTSGTNWVQVSAGGYHTAAIQSPPYVD